MKIGKKAANCLFMWPAKPLVLNDCANVSSLGSTADTTTRHRLSFILDILVWGQKNLISASWYNRRPEWRFLFNAPLAAKKRSKRNAHSSAGRLSQRHFLRRWHKHNWFFWFRVKIQFAPGHFGTYLQFKSAPWIHFVKNKTQNIITTLSDSWNWMLVG